MRRRALFLTLAGAWLCAAVATPAFVGAQESALELPVSELVAQDMEVDGAVVLVRGEAIGEPLRAESGHLWVNVLDDGTAIGVWMSEEDVAAIEWWGDYGTTGDEVEIRGTLNMACDSHGGDLDVHAMSVDVIGGGGEREHPLSVWKGIAGGLAIVAAVLLALRYRRHSAGLEV